MNVTKGSKRSFGQSDKSWLVIITHKLSSARGSRIFTSNKKGIVRILTISLFSLGITTAALFAYQQSTKDNYPFAISKEEAMKIALIEVDKEPNRNEALFPNEQASAKLIHVTDNGIGFISDENWLADMWLYSKENRFLEEYRNSYLWDVNVATSTNDGGMRGYSYMIDADSGRVIGNDRDYAYFEPWAVGES
jgi:hypothetical protein